MYSKRKQCGEVEGTLDWQLEELGFDVVLPPLILWLKASHFFVLISLSGNIKELPHGHFLILEFMNGYVAVLEVTLSD